MEYQEATLQLRSREVELDGQRHIFEYQGAKRIEQECLAVYEEPKVDPGGCWK